MARRLHLVELFSFGNNDRYTNRSQEFETGEFFFATVCDAFDWLYRSGYEGGRR